MSIGFTRNGSAMTNQVDLAPNSGGIPGFTMAAKYGEVGTGGIKIDDPTAALDVKGFDVIAAEESSCAIQRIYTGFVTERPITRLDPSGEDTREWDCNLVDLNTMLTWPRITGADGKRPAETDIARVAWLLSSGYLDDLSTELGGIVDTGFANTTDNPINFGEADYRWRSPADVLNDISGVSGKQFFVRWDETAGQVSLFYDLAIAAVSQSTIRVSNDPADEDADTFAPQGEVKITRSPQDVGTSVAYTYKGVTIFRTRPATEDAFGIKRVLDYSTERVGKRATAETQAAAFLENHANEFDDIEFELVLPAAKVNLLLEGDAVEVKFTHEPGYESFTWTRISRRVVGFETPGFYRVRYEASLGAKAGGGTGGGGGGFPWQPGECNPEFVQYKIGLSSLGGTVTTTLDADPTPGNILVAGMSLRDDSPIITPTGFTQIESQGFDDRNQSCALYYREVQPGDTAVIVSGPGNPSHTLYMFVAEFTGVDVVLGDSAAASDITHVAPPTAFIMPFGSLAVTAGGLVVGMGIVGSGAADPSTTTPQDGAIPIYTSGGVGTGGPGKWFGYRPITADGTYEMEVQWVSHKSGQAAISAFFACSSAADPGPPLPGQQVPPREPAGDVDGSNTDYVAPFPFSDASLVFLHDGIDQSDHLATQDGETGDFTLDYAPSAGSTLRTGLQGR